MECTLTLKKAKSSNITIIGSGLAGYTLVRELRRLDPIIPITVITQDSGDYYSKPQLSTALTHHKTPDQLILFTAEKFAEKFNINIQPNHYINNLNTINNAENPIILACGASPVIIKPIKNNNVIHHVNNLQDYKIFRDILVSPSKNQLSIIIIGSGLVGCEFANDLINAGYNVTVVSPDAYPLMRLIPKLAGEGLKQALADKGVVWKLGEFFDENQHQADIILSAIGLKPNSELAQKKGIKTNKGIVVNEYLQTSHDNIYALGDCAEIGGQVLPYIQPLSLGARALAKTLLGEPTRVEYPVMPVYIKTPAYPIVTTGGDGGAWGAEEVDSTGLSSLYYTQEKKITGFCLTGAKTAKINEFLGILSFP